MTTIPTIKQIFNDMLSDLEAEFSITLNPFGQSFLVAMSGGLSGIFYLLYLLIGGVQTNIWVDTCDIATLIRYGVIILSRNLTQATPGQYTCTVTGTVGATIPASSVFKSNDSSSSPGMLFQISAAYVMPGSSGTITINALAGGTASALVIGDTLTATAPILNVDAGITVASVVTDPIDAETPEAYRTKVIEKIQLRPGSWSAADYRLLGTSVTGVFQTYAYADSGNTAEVNVFLQGATPVADPGPSVSPTVVTAYQTALELVQPLPVWQVNYASSPINDIDITITMGAFSAFSTAQKSLILIALTNFINGVHPFIAACDNIADKEDVIATFNVSSVISNAVPGYGFSSVAFDVAGSPSTSWTADNGEIAFLNSISYV